MSEKDRFEIPKEMRSMAEASFSQARSAFEGFVHAAQQAAGAFESHHENLRSGMKDMSAKALAYAERNVQTSLDHAQKLMQAKDLAEVMRLHSEYVQQQMKALTEQASEFGQTMTRAVMDAAKPKM